METQRITVEDALKMSQAFLIPVTRPGAAVPALSDIFVIGRDPTCHLALTDPYASTRHARIERRNGHYIVRDLQSRNGTYLNGSRISEASLIANDRIRFGESLYVFSESSNSGPQLTSRNHLWNEQLKRLSAFASTDFSILIQGPSGSGKEILSQAIHKNSVRASGPLISINCSALGESLIESELFGHLRGSFTGATHDRKGAFEAARGGTLFLDEIGDLPLTLQPKLLRALENNEIRPVGSDRAIQTDVRIVAATHKNLAEAAQCGKFREDLFYRLNVCSLRPPALADRMEDFEDLLYQFAKQYRVRFSFGSIQKLKEHVWPGNVRELKNLVARASAYYPGHHIQPDDLTPIMEPVRPPPEVHFVSDSARDGQSSVIKEIEREMIIRRLVANNGNQRRTAKDLGLPKSTLHDRIRSYSIDLEAISPET